MSSTDRSSDTLEEKEGGGGDEEHGLTTISSSRPARYRRLASNPVCDGSTSSLCTPSSSVRDQCQAHLLERLERAFLNRDIATRLACISEMYVNSRIDTCPNSLAI